MVRNGSYPEKVRQAMAKLGWSVPDLAARTDLSLQYIQRTLQGRPLPESEERITSAIIDGFAGAAVDSIRRPDTKSNMRSRMKKAFIRVARQRELSIEEVSALTDKARSLRPAGSKSRDPLTVDDLRVWEAALEGLASEQRGFPETGLPSNRSDPVQLEKTVSPPNAQPIPCPRCPALIWQKDVARCPECGYGLDPNWN